MKRSLRLLTLAFVGLAACTGYAFWEAHSMPRVRQLELHVFRGKPLAQPIRIAFLSDTHLAGPSDSPARLRRVVAQVNAAKPDLVLLGGDYMGAPKGSDPGYTIEQAVRPFGGFKARFGVFAVLGNHDHWSGAQRTRRALEKVGVGVLANQAVVRGPMVIGGIDDDFTRHADVPATVRAVKAAGGIPIFFTHSPDLFAGLPSGNLLLAGHTHCGQIVLPLIGSPWTPSQFGNAYRCGKHRNESRMVIVTAGIGTTALPFRFAAPPDWWLITVTGGGVTRP
ncbi:MAG TPA: metallophosphoesterase [Sphingomicrobium sp.]